MCIRDSLSGEARACRAKMRAFRQQPSHDVSRAALLRDELPERIRRRSRIGVFVGQEISLIWTRRKQIGFGDEGGLPTLGDLILQPGLKVLKEMIAARGATRI